MASSAWQKNGLLQSTTTRTAKGKFSDNNAAEESEDNESTPQKSKAFSVDGKVSSASLFSSCQVTASTADVPAAAAKTNDRPCTDELEACLKQVGQD